MRRLSFEVLVPTLRPSSREVTLSMRVTITPVAADYVALRSRESVRDLYTPGAIAFSSVEAAHESRQLLPAAIRVPKSTYHVHALCLSSTLGNSARTVEHSIL